MYWVLLGLVAVGQATPAPRPQGATTVANFDFQTRAGGDYAMPEGWTRVIQPGFPFFIDVTLTRDVAAVADRSLVFRLNGGNCALFSPRIEASDEYNYFFQGQVKTDGLQHDRAYLLLEFLDSRRQVVGRQQLTQTLTGTRDWTLLSVGPVAPPSSAVRFLRIACISRHGTLKDLSGSVYFDDLWVGRLPRINVRSSSPYRLFKHDDDKVISVEVTGLDDRRMDVRYYLSDENRKPLSEFVDEIDLRPDNVGLSEWEVPIADVGYYHLDIGLREGNRQILQKDFPVTVVRSPAPVRTDFGISAPVAPFGLDHYEQLLRNSASRWLKMPLWAKARDPQGQLRRDPQFAFFVERLEERGHTVIGSMEKAPQELLKNLPRNNVSVSEVFTLPKEKWSGEIEGLQAMFGLKVTHWQVGGDADTGFEGVLDPNALLRELQTEMRQFGREVHLGVPWSWHTPLPDPGILQFLSLSDAPPYALSVTTGSPREWSPLSPGELLAALVERRAELQAPVATLTSSTSIPQLRSTPPQLWVQIAPVSSLQYPRTDQIRDFFFRVLAAKEGEADCILCTRIDELNRGLFAEDGAPTERFTIWRTMAEYLGGKRVVGQLPLQTTQNRVLSDPSSATVVVWNERPTTINVVTGEGTQITDLWGRTRATGFDDIAHEVLVGPWPLLLTNCDLGLLRLQMETQFLKGRLSSETGRHEDALVISNPFPFTLSGKIRFHFPASWRAKPDVAAVQIQPGETAQIPIVFDIPQGISHGETTVKLDFDVATDQRYQFSIERKYRLGLDEIDVTSQTRLLASGDLEVRVAIMNQLEDPISLRCLLRAYQQNVIVGVPVENLRTNDLVTRVFLVPNGKEQLGRTMKLELRQINGRRQYSVEIPVNL